MSEGHYPEWPAPRWATKDEAVAYAVAESEPGDEVVIHQGYCAMKWDEPCNCSPDVVVVRVVQA